MNLIIEVVVTDRFHCITKSWLIFLFIKPVGTDFSEIWIKKQNNCHSRKLIWKCLQNGDHFVSQLVRHWPDITDLVLTIFFIFDANDIPLCCNIVFMCLYVNSKLVMITVKKVMMSTFTIVYKTTKVNSNLINTCHPLSILGMMDVYKEHVDIWSLESACCRPMI